MQNESKTMNYYDLAPQNCFTQPKESSLWISGFRMFQVPQNTLNTALIVDLEHVRIWFFRGSLSYHDSSNLKFEMVADHQWKVDASDIKTVHASEDTYALALSPLMIDGVDGDEAATRDRIRSALGLITTYHTKAAVFQHLFDNIVLIGQQKTISFSLPVENPMWFPPVNLDDTSVSKLRELQTSLMHRSEKDRNRIYLALRWIYSSATGDDPVDRFIKSWIAVETLSMPDSTNILSANQCLARGYDIKVAEAKEKFRLGRLFNLRSEIVHNGKRVSIHGELLRYMEYLFSDLLSITLGVECQRRAQRVLEEASTQLAPYLGRG